MKLPFSFPPSRLLGFAGFFAITVIVFLLGAHRQARSLAALEPLESRLREQSAERACQMAEWEPGTAEERELQTYIRQRCLAAVPSAADARLRGSAAIAAQAERCGLRQVVIEDVPVLEGPGGNEGWEEEDAPAALAIRIGGDEPPTVLERFDFTMESTCDFRSLVAFIADLGRDGVSVELRSLTVSKNDPALKVKMELSVYGRDA